MTGKFAGRDLKGSGRPRKKSRRASLKRKFSDDLPALIRPWKVRLSVRHLHGPRKVVYGKDELLILCLVRNAQTYIESFIEHYLSMGAKHIVFLDNGSEDETISIARNHERVTVLQTKLSFKKYRLEMKQYLVYRFGRDRWSLSVDQDELFDYPYSDVVSLKSLLGYLNDNRYTAVVCYMLDMFSGKPLSRYDAAEEDEPLKERYRFYDISEVRTQGYREVGDIGNVISNEEIEVLQGGVQRKVFHISPLLTKHCLLFLDDELRPMDLSDHWAGGARIADFTGVLLHYKLSASLYGLVRRELEERRYISRHGKYERYAKVLEGSEGTLLMGETAKELKSVKDLVGSRILPVSREYMRFVEGEEQNSGRSSEESRLERVYEAFFNARSQVAADGKRLRDLERQLAEVRGALNVKMTELRRSHNEQRRLEMRLENELKIQSNLRARAGKAEREIREVQKMAELRSELGKREKTIRWSHNEQRLREKGGQPEENQRLVQKVHGLERQLEAIRGSRTWRLMEILHRVKARVFGLGKDSP